MTLVPGLMYGCRSEAKVGQGPRTPFASQPPGFPPFPPIPLWRGAAPLPSRGEGLKGPRRGRSGSSTADAARILLPPSRFALYADEGKRGRAGVLLGLAVSPVLGSPEEPGGKRGRSQDPCSRQGAWGARRAVGRYRHLLTSPLPPAGGGRQAGAGGSAVPGRAASLGRRGSRCPGRRGGPGEPRRGRGSGGGPARGRSRGGARGAARRGGARPAQSAGGGGGGCTAGPVPRGSAPGAAAAAGARGMRRR